MITAIAMILGYVNSFLLMSLVNATTIMWVLWGISTIMVVIGMVVSAIGKRCE